MKRLVSVLLVLVFMRDGRVLKYPDATTCMVSGGSSPLIGADTPDTLLTLYRWYKDYPDDMLSRCKEVTVFNLSTVERWEIQ